MELKSPRLIIRPPICPVCENQLHEQDLWLIRDSRLQCPWCLDGIIRFDPPMQFLVEVERPLPKVGDLVHGQVFIQGIFPQMRLFNETTWRARFEGFVPDVGEWIEARVHKVGKKTMVVTFEANLSDEVVSFARAWVGSGG